MLIRQTDPCSPQGGLHFIFSAFGFVFNLSYKTISELIRADKIVKIWTPEVQGKLMFPHNSAIQALAFNPITKTLASGTELDLGLWNENAQQVKKEKVPSRITSLAFATLSSRFHTTCLLIPHDTFSSSLFDSFQLVIQWAVSCQCAFQWACFYPEQGR